MHSRTLVMGLILALGAIACSSASSEEDALAEGALTGRAAGGSASKRNGNAAAAPEEGPVIVSHFDTPTAAGLQPVIDAIDGAHSSIRMAIYHLTVPPVVDAFAKAAQRGVDVQIIVDNTNWTSHTPDALKKQLADAGVKVTPSSKGFRITHEKSFVVDESTAYIMSLNLTSPFVVTRDYAVVTTDKGIVSEFLTVFAADLDNAKNGTANTPLLTDPHLAWSPVNSEGRLVAFIEAAEKSLVVSSENLGDAAIQKALIAAAGRGVNVRVLAPLCDQNPVVTFDLPYLAALAKGGADARAMPGPASADLPYTHAKMMIADDARAYIGSINFSTASTTDAREVGIFFDDAPTISTIAADFEHDWAKAVAPPPASDAKCGAASSG
jgi:phosphatidylserine/phosphatidylglycerophosphate/cardiolipin synthase-like enzyme